MIEAAISGEPAARAPVAVIICAAGLSARFSGAGTAGASRVALKKEYLPLPGDSDGVTVLGAAVRAFLAVPEVATIVVVVPDDPKNGEAAAREAIPAKFLAGETGPPIHFVKGGKTRRTSVYNALAILLKKFPGRLDARGYVLIHDGARPWISPVLIKRIIGEVKKHNAVTPLVSLTETPKETNLLLDDTFGSSPVYVKQHLRRACIGVSQTPQAFAFPEIFAAHKQAAARENDTGVEFTDDAEIWGEFRGPVAVIPGDPGNRKITFPEDLA